MSRSDKPCSLLLKFCGVLFGICAAILPGSLLAQQPPPGSQPGSTEWQRQQPTRERAQDLLRQEGEAASPAERRQELRSLNELHRELMPRGTTVPAPGVAPPSGSSPDRGTPRRD